MELPPFQWPRAAGEVEAQVALVEAATHQCWDAVAAVPDDQVSFDTVVKPLMNPPHFKTNPLLCQAKFMQHCSTDAAVREAADAAGTKFAKLKSMGRTRADVYAKVKAFQATPAYGTLSVSDKWYCDSIATQFESSGLGLSKADQDELQRFRDEDARVCAEYKKNLGEDKTVVTFEPSELEGLDEKWLKDRTKDDGKVHVTLQYPDLIPVMSTCAIAASRRKLSTAREVDAYKNNLDLVAEGIKYRKGIAKLLGRETWAHHAVATRMAQTPEKIHAFIDSLVEKVKPGAQRDLETLRSLKAEHLQERGELVGDAKDVELDATDSGFYANLLLKRKYGVDNEAVRKYFPLDHVVQVTMDIYQELLGLKFEEKTGFDSWHDEVRLFRVTDLAEGHLVGFFYLDLHPRDGKYGHAAIFHILKRWGEQVPVDCMLCNLPAPSADGTPALLRHSDCVTFFHEFGHIMHGLCAEGDGNGTTLAKCPRDFVEAPSQMLENWCWTKEGLMRLSKHHETGATLPQDQLDKMLAAKNVGAGMHLLRQVYLSSLDLAIHGASPPPDAAGLQALVDEMRPRISLVKNPENANMLRSFGHLMNQYSAAYYGYMWAEVLSADMFATCFEKDPFSKEAGMRYRKLVLAPGGVGAIGEHLKGFLGRDPEQQAFLKSNEIA